MQSDSEIASPSGNHIDGGTFKGPVIQAGEFNGEVHLHQPERQIVPHQLPGSIRHFIGRELEISRLSKLLEESISGPGTVVISAIDGVAGIGKTALAIHWSHLVSGKFTDGQLYVNLRGFDPLGVPMSSAAAVRILLEGLVSACEIPTSLEAQVALYRSTIANRKMLIVLDNALSADQVRPLLPGSATCLTLVTSRNRLTSLVAQEGAQLLNLQTFTDRESVALLGRFIDREKITQSPDTVSILIKNCANLPLALAILGSRAVANQNTEVSRLVRELGQEKTRLNAFSTGEPTGDLQTIFSWSYRALSEPTRRLFQLLGLHSGPDVGVCTAASIAGQSVSETRLMLDELVRSNLIDEFAPARYRSHDLVKNYAAVQAAENLGSEEREKAILRCLDHYLHNSYRADIVLYPHRDPIPMNPCPAYVAIEDLDSYDRAMDWFKSEHLNLMAAVELADTKGFYGHAWQIPWALADYFNRQGHWRDWISSHRTAVKVAKDCGDLPALARMRRILAHAYRLLGDYREALVYLNYAADAYRDVGDQVGKARTHRALSWVFHGLQKYEEALKHAEHAVTLYRSTGHKAGEARSLNAIGVNQVHLGNLAVATESCMSALDLTRAIGDRAGEAHALRSLAAACERIGEFDVAIEHLTASIYIYKDLKSARNQASSLVGLGDIHLEMHNHEKARIAWEEALSILANSDQEESELIRAKLARVSGGGS